MTVTLRDCPHSPVHKYSQRHVCRAQRYAERPSTRRQIFDSSEVAHLFAHKAQQSARNHNGSLFFESNIIYSWGKHFPIARHVEYKGKNAVLFTTGTYSVSTSGHCSTVRSAISHLTTFDVPNVLANSVTDHKANLTDYAKRINVALLNVARAKSNKAWKHSNVLELRTEAIAYAKFFNLKYSDVVPKVPALDSVQLAAIKKLEDKRLAAERKKKIQENKESIERWRNGEYVRLPLGLPDMLRVSKDGSQIETSRNASFPISHAKRGLALVRAVISRGETWHTNGITCKLGHYQIDFIDTNGNVVAGCHKVSYSEIERIAPQIDAAPTVLESLEA